MIMYKAKLLSIEPLKLDHLKLAKSYQRAYKIFIPIIRAIIP